MHTGPRSIRQWQVDRFVSLKTGDVLYSEQNNWGEYFNCSIRAGNFDLCILAFWLIRSVDDTDKHRSMDGSATTYASMEAASYRICRRDIDPKRDMDHRQENACMRWRACICMGGAPLLPSALFISHRTGSDSTRTTTRPIEVGQQAYVMDNTHSIRIRGYCMLHLFLSLFFFFGKVCMLHLQHCNSKVLASGSQPKHVHPWPGPSAERSCPGSSVSARPRGLLAAGVFFFFFWDGSWGYQ